MEFKDLTKCIRKALDYVEERQGGDGGFGYAGKGDTHAPNGYLTLTGAGMLSLQMWDKGASSTVRNGGRYIEKRSKFEYNGADCDLYGHYYEGQAMMNRGADLWKKYNTMFRDQVLNNQNGDGSWKTPGGGQKPNAVGAEFVGNAHYRTCLSILMLEVYYRFLPGTGGGK
jgi:hypothetical protein